MSALQSMSWMASRLFAGMEHDLRMASADLAFAANKFAFERRRMVR
ncbi:hypothetical protein [Sphingobium ummariense]